MSETTCSQAGCQVETSGRCLEGFSPPETCPYFAGMDREQEDAASITDQELATYSSQELVPLPSGEALTERQAAEVARDERSYVIVIAGPVGSGKTTILTSLYEAFLEAPFANYFFRGSRTLVGFERRCHLGREESGTEFANTAHTSMREGVVFLHLDLASKDESDHLRHEHLLLSDISGELFKRLRDSSNAAHELIALKRANHLCLALDGEKISHAEYRHVTYNDSRSILRSIIESGMLPHQCVIDIAFTKWDVVVAAIRNDNAGEIASFIERTKSTLTSVAKNFDIRFHQVATRPPKDASIPFAYGVPTLLRSWMADTPAKPRLTKLYLGPKADREFSRFTEAVIATNRLEDRYAIQRF
jgi:hypothetical protein